MKNCNKFQSLVQKDGGNHSCDQTKTQQIDVNSRCQRKRKLKETISNESKPKTCTQNVAKLNCGCRSQIDINEEVAAKRARYSTMPALKLQKQAPFFEGTAVLDGKFGNISINDYKGSYLILFFYPMDFTFVCPTEIIAFSERITEFTKIKCQIIGCSTDSEYSHLAWMKMDRKNGGLGKLNYPLLSDKSMKISRSYGVLDEDTGVPFRGLFIIDPLQNLRQIIINDLPIGRSVDEALRLVQAIQFTDNHGEVCPVNWKPGGKTIVPDPAASLKYFKDSN